MIKVAICDDDGQLAHQLENIICKICDRESIGADTEVFYNGNTLEKEIVIGQRFDLIYLDIQMDNGDGISTARNIRKLDENAIFIFVSGYDKYVMELFRLDVFSFLKKPIDEDEFSSLFLEANKKICNNNFFFTFKYRNSEYKIETYMFNGKLSDVEKDLEKGKIPFLRIHQSYLVNYLLIKSRTKAEVTLINGTKLPISEDRQKEFNRDYGKLLRGEING